MKESEMRVDRQVIIYSENHCINDLSDSWMKVELKVVEEEMRLPGRRKRPNERIPVYNIKVTLDKNSITW